MGKQDDKHAYESRQRVCFSLPFSGKRNFVEFVFRAGGPNDRLLSVDNSTLTNYRRTINPLSTVPIHYDFTLTWEGDDMFSAVPDALEPFGLKLEMKKVPT